MDTAEAIVSIDKEWLDSLAFVSTDQGLLLQLDLDIALVLYANEVVYWNLVLTLPQIVVVCEAVWFHKFA